MSKVNRTDRMSRRLLGFLGRIDAVEAMVKGGPKVTAVEAECRALAVKVEALAMAVTVLDNQRADAARRLTAALERITALERSRVVDAPLASETAAEAVAAIPATQD